MKISLKLALIILAAASFIVYFNTLNNNFVYDDETIIVKNADNLNLKNIPGYFTNQGEYRYVFGALYRPLIMTSFAIDHTLFGLKPGGFHFVNIIFHTVSTIFLFLILLMFFGKYEFGILSALLSSLIFAVHPVHTEAVSFISSRTDVLATMFFFMSFYYFLIYRGFSLPKYQKEKSKDKKQTQQIKSPVKKYFIYSLTLYFLGLLSKEMIITLPLIFLLFDLLVSKEKIKTVFKDYIILFGVSLLYFIIRHFAIQGVETKPVFDWFYSKDMIVIIATMVKTIPVYFKLMFFPLGLVYNYNGVISYSNSLLEINSLLSILFIIAVITLSIYLIKNKIYYSYSILVFFVGLLPVINIIPTANIMAERYLYMLTFPLCVAIAYFISENMNLKNQKTYAWVFVIIIIFLGFLTTQRNQVWKTNETLWMSAEGDSSPSSMINIAGLYTRSNHIEKAEKLYVEALAINQYMINAHINLGIINMVRGKYDTAEVKLKNALEIDSKNPNANYMYAKLKLMTNKPSDAKNILENMESNSLEYKDSKRMLDSLKRSGI
ncbi:MAG: tetratricopeptide repeat protein [Candidatus Kapaibacterium sp.]